MNATRLRKNQRCGVGFWDDRGNRRVRAWITVDEATRIAGFALENIARWDRAAREGHANPLLCDYKHGYFLTPPGWFAYDRRRARGLERWPVIDHYAEHFSYDPEFGCYTCQKRDEDS